MARAPSQPDQPPSDARRPPPATRRLGRAEKVIARSLLAFALFVVALMPGSALRAPSPEPTPVPVPVVQVPKSGKARLDVRVTADDRPLGDARVRVFFTTDDGSAIAAEARTKGDGHALFTRLPRGAFWIVVDAVSRARAASTLSLEEDDTTRELAVPLGPEHTLQVRVRDEEGRPVPKAEVEVMAASPVPVGIVTDEEGEAIVPRLGTGPYAVAARAAGLEETTRTNVPEGTPFEIVLRKLGTLVVRVVGADGVRASGARVEIAGGALGSSRSGDTNEAGELRITSLPTSAYALRATKGAAVSATELDVRLEGGEEKSLELRLGLGVFVDVRAFGEDTDGELALGGAHVVVAEDGLSPFPLEAVTDRGGRAHLGPLVRGAPAAVSVTASGFVSRGGVAVREPGTTEVKVVLLRAGTIEGRVVDARGFPIGGATLVVVGTDRSGGPVDEDPRRARVRDSLFAASLVGPAPLLPRGELGVVPGPVPGIPKAGPSFVGLGAPLTPRSAVDVDAEPWTTREDGTFRLFPVPPGRVRVLARHPQYVESASEVVSLDPSGRAEVSLVLKEGGLLEGTVVDARGRPEAGARVTVLATRGLLDRSSRTAEDGRFAFASLPESVTLLAFADGGRSSRSVVEIKDGERREVKIVLPAPRDPIDVRVRDDRDFPVDAVQLSVGSLDPNAPLRVTAFTDSRGEARVAGVRGLPLRIVASHPRHASKSITLPADANAASVTIAIDRGESLVGEVIGRRAGALDAAEITVTSESGTVRTSSNARGEFRFDGLPATKLRLSVRAQAHATLEKGVTMEARRGARPTDLGRLELVDESVVEGDVVDDAGKPVPGARVGTGTVPTWVPTGVLPAGLAQTDSRGAFRLGGLAEGTVSLEAYAADVGRGRVDNVRVSPGRPTGGIRILVAREAGGGPGSGRTAEASTTGNVAVTLGVTEEGAVVLTHVVDGSAAERAGLSAADRIVDIDGTRVRSMEDARARLAGPVQDDVILVVARGERSLTLRVPREATRR